MVGQLWVPICKLLWLQLHTHMVEAGLCLEHANGISGGALHCTTQGNLLSVSCSQRLRATNLEWAGYSGACRQGESSSSLLLSLCWYLRHTPVEAPWEGHRVEESRGRVEGALAWAPAREGLTLPLPQVAEQFRPSEHWSHPWKNGETVLDHPFTLFRLLTQ